MAEVRLAHTSQLDGGTLASVRALLEDAFAGDFSDDDWDHSLGGMHAIATVGGDVVGHASVVPRSMLHAGRAWRVGYVEGVAVRQDRRRRGTASRLLDAIEDVIVRGHDFGALSPTELARPFYLGRGWQGWTGKLAALTPAGPVGTPGEEVLIALADDRIDRAGTLTCDFRNGDLW